MPRLQAGIAAILVFDAGFFYCRRSRQRKTPNASGPEDAQAPASSEETSAAGSETASFAGCSLSKMKREQVRVVRETQAGYETADAFVHTDGGLQLTAGRVVDDLPPTYVAD
ncbi:hypothetical protein DFH09DRAFT_1330697 [Mycena vulgaris]|nr:hypothetical protein DFH09DRAFT_1330697 [Mycena vulgaris]